MTGLKTATDVKKLREYVGAAIRNAQNSHDGLSLTGYAKMHTQVSHSERLAAAAIAAYEEWHEIDKWAKHAVKLSEASE